MLSKHRIEGSLPPILSCEFPTLESFSWHPVLSKKSISFADDLRFSVARLLSQKDRIESYVKLRDQFSRSLMLGDLNEAQSVVDSCRERFGISNWLLEARLLLADTSGGFEQTREELSEILKLPIHQNSLLIAEFASQRVDMTMSVVEYMRRIHQMASREEYKAFDASLPSYLCFVNSVPHFDLRPFTLEESSYILRSEAVRPIIDQYQSLIRLLRSLYATGQRFLGSEDANSPIRQFLEITDPDLSFLTLVLDEPGKWRFGHELASTQNLVVNNSDNAIELCVERLLHSPQDFGFYELLAIACIQADKNVPDVFPTDSIAQQLLDSTEHFLRFGDDGSDAYWQLVKRSNALACTSMGPQIDAICVRGYPFSSAEIRKMRIIYSGSVAAGLFPSETLLGGLDANEQIGKVRRSLFVSPTNDKPDSVGCAESSSVLNQLCVGKDLASDKNFPDALECFRRVLESEGNDAFCAAEALRGAVECSIQLSQYGVAASLIEKSNVYPLALTHLVPIGELVSRYDRNDPNVDLRCIAWPNLHFLDHLFGQTTARQLYSAYANFLSAHGVSRAHELPDKSDYSFNSIHLELFLRCVCRIDCMESDWVAFGGTSEVEQERVAILHKLQLLYPQDVAEYAEEISQLQQQVSVREAINSVADSKIYFNLEGIEKSLPKSFVERFNRYQLYKKLAHHKRRIPSSEWIGEESTSRETEDGAFSQFADLFREIWRTVLFSNEHGLNSYLSLRIRHQTIHGAVRSIFDRFRLIAEKDKEVYCTDGYWSKTLSSIEPETHLAIETCLAEFASRIDRTIEIASSRWVKIRDGNRNLGGWFDLEFSDTELRHLSSKLAEVVHPDQFIDEVVYIIRERLNDSLVTVRGKVQSVFGARLHQELERLSAGLREKCKTVPAEVDAAITHCQTALQNGIDEIASWFQLQDELSLKDFLFDTLVDASIENVRKCYPSSNFKCERIGGSSVLVAGRHFPSLWYLLFLLFGNVVRHSGGSSDETSLTITQTDEILSLTIRSKLGETVSSEDAQAKVDAALTHEPTMIPKEGGSGFSKIRNILQSDLGLNQNSFNARVAGQEFVAVISIETNHICA